MSLRFVLPLTIALCLIAYALVPITDSLTLRWFTRDVDIRAKLVANTLQESLASLIEARSVTRIDALLNRAIQDERLYAIGFCNSQGRVQFKTITYPKFIECPQTSGPEVANYVVDLPQGHLHVASHPILGSERYLGQLVLVHDMSFVRLRSADTKWYIVYLFLGLGGVISILTVLIARLSWLGWVNGMRSMLRGDGLLGPGRVLESAELQPIAKDLRLMIKDLEDERRARDENRVSWSSKSLKDILQRELKGDEILIVSNREPYIHVHRGESIETQFPASGLVTALEPIMRACSGTWIAHGSGNADREVVDKFDHVQVPPSDPSYQVRRVWLTPEEEQGYYYGFSNEGMWPLCHIAHVRPIFRSEDWAHYVSVNEKFAQAVIEEASSDNPVILVQDYHFALLPKMIRERLPNATVITFWHIPFPNSEVFGICPWREKILEGMLGSSILGFHTLSHCHNFLDAVDRFLESRIDREFSTVSYRNQLTAINHYPISIEYPNRWQSSLKPVGECRANIRSRHGLSANHHIGIGVDRLDYTKGILEKFRAVERFLELESQWIGKFTFIQIAAPSRSSIEQYKQFEVEARALAAKINHRFGREGYSPILLQIEHHEPESVYEHYRAADFCFVNSLHDGMNLVAKEFVAIRDDEGGSLILSQFTGAARELHEALIVNPYDIDQCAGALKIALEMSERQQKHRISSMRGYIQEFNVYRWAGRMLLDAARIRRRSRLFGQVDSVSVKVSDTQEHHKLHKGLRGQV